MRGGKRPGAGRKPGSINRISAEARKRAQESGILPLDYMLAVLRDVNEPPQRRDDMAKAAAPYCHPKLANVEHAGKGGGPIQVHITGDDAGLL